MKWIQLHSDPLPDSWSGEQTIGGCTNGGSEYFQVQFTADGPSVTGNLEATAHCGNKVTDSDFKGTATGHVALVTFKAGFADPTQPAQAALVIHHNHAYWQVLTWVDVEDYTWPTAQLDRK